MSAHGGGITGFPKHFERLVVGLVIVSFVIFINDKFIGVNVNTKNKSEDNRLELNYAYKVSKVVDGDTLHLKKIDGTDFKSGKTEEVVRLIGINTPESVDPNRPVECFGMEASKYVKSLADGQLAAIETDDTQATYDRYGRLLAYIYIKDGGLRPADDFLLNEKVIKNGYAYEYTYDSPYKYQELFKSAESYARENGIGLWNENTCKGLKTPVAAPPKAY